MSAPRPPSAGPRGARSRVTPARDPGAETPPALSLGEQVAVITLCRPSRHNALGAEDVTRFHEHLDVVDSRAHVRVLVVTGAGNETFCSGASLGEIERGELTPERFATLTDGLAAARVPTVAALNGSVYGGGAEVALSCDFRIGVTGARLLVPAARLGMCYPVAGQRRFVERLGLAVAMRILVAGEELDADEMVRVGFLTRAVSPDRLGAATNELAARLAAAAPLAAAGMKEILRGVAAGALDPERAEELARRCAESRDLREGLRAKREGDEPSFEGR